MVNWIGVKTLLYIASINKLSSRSTDFVLAFNQYDLDLDVFMDISFGMGVDGNRGEWFLKLNKQLYGIKQASENWIDLL